MLDGRFGYNTQRRCNILIKNTNCSPRIKCEGVHKEVKVCNKDRYRKYSMDPDATSEDVTHIP